MPTDPARLRILLVTRNLPPLVGGMERLLQEMAEGIAGYADLTVIGPKGCGEHLPGNIEVLETSPKLAPFLLISTVLAIITSRKKQFDIAIGGSGLIAPTLQVISRLFKHKTLIYLHGLDLVVHNYLYQQVFVRSIRTIDSVIVNSRNTRELALEKGIAATRIAIVNPGTSLPAMPDRQALQKFRARHGIPFSKVMIFVGRMTQRKGLSGFIKNSLPAIFASEPDTGLVVVGKNPEDSLNRLGEEKEILSLVSGHENKDRIIFLGQLSDAELQTCYGLADVQIFPLVEIEGDVEGFGMVAIEAAAMGTPTVAFCVGGVEDAIGPGNGVLVEPGDYDVFARSVIQILHGDSPSEDSCISHAANFSWDIFEHKIRASLITS